MRIALLVGGVTPNPTTGGGAVTAWTTMLHLVEQGHEVTVVVLADPEAYDEPGIAAREALVRERADLVVVRSRATSVFENLPGDLLTRARRALDPAPEALYPTIVDGEALRAAVAEIDSDVAFVYHFEALAASRTLTVPRLAIVGDPPHLSALYHFRRNLPRLRGLVRLQAQVRRQPRLLVEMLNECDASGAFAAHHADWLRRRGADGAEYFRTPVPDPGAVERREAEVPRILLVGHLRGAVTLEGLKRFAVEILPRLETALGEDGFEVRVAGGYDPPAALAPFLDRPSVRLLGHVEEMADEFRSSHVMVVPNSITLGIRVRIITAFSYGCCIVTDRANTLGIPELVDGDNALVGDSPQTLANQILRALGDPSLRAQLGAGARATYERAFHPDVAVGRIASTLEQIAPAHDRAGSR